MLGAYRFAQDTDAPAHASGIYMIVHVATGRVYVGQTCNGFAKRCKEHHYNATKAKAQHADNKFGRSVRKHGSDAFAFHVVQVIDLSCANDVFNEAERAWIEKTNAVVPHGFNVHPQGATPRGIVRSAETRKKMSESRKRAIAANPDWAVALKARLSSENHSTNSRERTKKNNADPEFQRLRAEGMRKWRDDPVSAAVHAAKLTAAWFGNPARAEAHSERMIIRMADPVVRAAMSKPLLCIETGIVYPSTKEAARSLGMHPQAITACIAGRHKTAGGFRWVRVADQATQIKLESVPVAANDAVAHLAA